MNRKKKINDLYKGVFKNDKKGCLVDLKPLENRQEINIQHNSPPKQYNNNNNNNNSYLNQCNQQNNKHNYPKQIDISLKVAKNLGFGTYFKNLREDILDVFLGKEDLISFESMFNHKDVSDLFNFKESILKTNATTQIGQGKTKSSMNNNNNNNNFKYSHISNNNNNNNDNSILNQFNQNTNSTEQEVILYEDEDKTIFKRKKMKSKLSKENEQQCNNTRYISVAQENVNNVNPTNRNTIGYYPYQNYNMNTNHNYNVPMNIPMKANMNMFNPMNNDYNDINKGMYTPNKNEMNLGNNFSKNSVLFMNKISNCRHINGNYLSIPNISHN